MTSARALHAAVTVARHALDRVAAAGREGHDVPRAALEAAHAVYADHADAARLSAATVVPALWGELLALDASRLQGADAGTRAATGALARAARLACAPATWHAPFWEGESDVRHFAWLVRGILGEAGAALVGAGWPPADAWQEVLERYDAAGGSAEVFG